MRARRSQICGLDVHSTRNDEESSALCVAHILALRQHSCFRDARIVLIPEANLGNEAQSVARNVLLKCGHGVEVAVENEGCYGVLTTPQSKPMYVFHTRSKLTESAIRYHENMVVANPAQMARGMSYEERVATVRKEFERQLAMFRVADIVPESMRQNRARVYGAMDNDNRRSTRLRDDMAMALLMAVHWSGQLRIGQISTRNRRNMYTNVL